MNNELHLNRRQFLRTTGQAATTLAAASTFAPAILAAESPTKTTGVGCIGLGTRGGDLLEAVAHAPNVKVTAISDVYGPHRQKGLDRCLDPQAKAYVDYRELLADKNVDAVVIASPDHCHYPMVLDAVKAGKDIYCEKGFSRTLAEAKLMRDALKKSKVVFRAAPTLFPVDGDGNTVVMHRASVYNKDALWNDVKQWFDGGAAASGSINPEGAAVQKLSDGGAGWKIWPPKKGEEPVPLAWKTFASPFTPDPLTFGYRWNDQLTRAKTGDGSVVKLPEYFHLTTNANKKPEWTPVSPKAVPADTKLASLNFDRPSEPVAKPYTTPEEPDSCWRKPGPAAGPFQARLGDGSVVTYYWYRFADQPALLNAGLTTDEREQLQKRVEKIHRSWPKDRDYLAPPTVGTLCDLDPALLITPPQGKEAGYVPIATRQEWGGAASPLRGR
jgi:hypothetical protein